MPADPPPAEMRAIVMRGFGEPDVLRPESVPTPQPRPGEALVAVGAVEVSRTRDVATRRGRHPYSREMRFPHVLGGHAAGVVAAVGEDVDPALLGRPVALMHESPCGQCGACRAGTPDRCERPRLMGIHGWGSYAQFAAVPAAQLHLLPPGIDMLQAAALAATGPVALEQLRAAGAGPGSTVLVTGASGSLATMLAALAERSGAEVVGLSRRASAVQHVPALDATSADLTDRLRELGGGRGPSIVIDNICSPEIFDAYFPALPFGARIVVSGAIGDPQPALTVPARSLYVGALSLLGVRSHSDASCAAFWQLVREGFRLPATVIREFPLPEAAAVHDAVENGATSGHTVLRVPVPHDAGTADPTAMAATG